MLYILAAAFAAIAGFGAVTIGDYLEREQWTAERQAPSSSPPATTQNTGGNLSAASTGDGRGGMTKQIGRAHV